LKIKENLGPEGFVGFWCLVDVLVGIFGKAWQQDGAK